VLETIVRGPRVKFRGGHRPGARHAYRMKKQERGGSLGRTLGPREARRDEAMGVESLYRGLEGSGVHAHLIFLMYGTRELLIFVFNGVSASSSPSFNEGLHSQITIFRLHQV
jgi:hypothetical protein